MARRATSAEIVAALDVMTVAGEAEVSAEALAQVTLRLERRRWLDYEEFDWREQDDRMYT